jgi:DNA polymerase III epsilon subunit-like protein
VVLNRNFLILDTETGGTNPYTAALLTLGMIAVKDGKTVGRDYIQVLPKEGDELNPNSLLVNGINLEEHLKVAIPREDAAKRVKRFVYNHFGHTGKQAPHPVGHNLPFDINVLFRLFNEFEMAEPFSRFHFDTRYIAPILMLCGMERTANSKLDKFMEHYQITLPASGVRHNAADDAFATYEVFMAMIDDLCKRGLPISLLPGVTKYGCHLDLSPGETPDECYIDTGHPDDCCLSSSGKVKCKEHCPHWKPFTVHNA